MQRLQLIVNGEMIYNGDSGLKESDETGIMLLSLNRGDVLHFGGKTYNISHKSVVWRTSTDWDVVIHARSIIG